MKRKLLAAAGCTTYFIIFLGLLLLQQKNISGEVEKGVAAAASLLLFLPCPLLLHIFLREESTKEENTRADMSGLTPLSPSLFQTRCIALGLSAREAEVARLICLGYRNRQIAEELFISEATVKKHASHIYEKLHVDGRKALREKIEK